MDDWRVGEAGEIDIAGQRLEVIRHGPPPAAAPTIVMLHEGLGCVALWREFPQQLAAATGFGVAAYSRAGYGRSGAASRTWPLDYMTREALDVLPCVLDALGVKSAVLLGHSDGASIAAIYAGGVVDFRVRGLVLIAPHFFTEPSGLAAIAAAKHAFDAGDLRARLAKYHRDVDSAFRGWSEAWLDPGFVKWHIADCIDYLRVPTLAIQGAGDPYGTLAQIRELESRIYAPLDVEILADCGHAPHVERPAETLAAIAEFCARLRRIEGAGARPG